MDWQEYQAQKRDNPGMAEFLGSIKYKQRAKYPNKLKLKEFCKEHEIPTAELITTGNIEQGLPGNLPKQYCLKPTNGCSARGVFLMKDGVDLKTDEPKTAEEIIQEYQEQMNQGIKFSSTYFIEELELKKGYRPTDIKCFSINQKPWIYLVVKSEKQKTFYDHAWNYIDGLGEPIEVEKKKEVTELARRILEIFNPLFLRVDILEGDEVTLGELTKVSGNPGIITRTFRQTEKGVELDGYLGFLIDQEYQERKKSNNPDRAIYNIK